MAASLHALHRSSPALSRIAGASLCPFLLGQDGIVHSMADYGN